jgi:AraC-like DNA-binding protein
MSTVDLAVRLAGASIALYIALVWLRDAGRHPSGWLVALFAFGVASYLLCPPMAREWQLGLVEVPFFAGCFSVAVFFFLMTCTIFDDSFRLRWWHGFLVLVAVMLGAARWLITQQAEGGTAAAEATGMLLLAHQILSLGLTGFALIVAARGLPADLVEPRRRLRLAFIGVSGAYGLGIIVTEIYLRGAAANPGVELANAAAILILAIGFAATMTGLRPAFAPTVEAAPRPDRQPVEEADSELIGQLRRSMEQDAAYRDESLTIATLARQLGTQEYILRRTINGSLGYRNFNRFVNHYRLAEACARLADPAEKKLPILSIALECGFASIGPFNRAFKEEMGTTPGAYRRKSLGQT